MAMEMATRIQDDFSSIVLTSFARKRPAGRSCGLRTEGPLFRTNLSLPRPHPQWKRTYSTAKFVDRSDLFRDLVSLE
jgi:hypothetical protein